MSVALWVAAALAVSPQPPLPVAVYAYLGERERMALTFRQGDETLCRVARGHEAKMYDAPVCRFTVALDAGDLVLSGSVEGRHWDDGRAGRWDGERRFRLLDLAPVTAPLARRGGDFGEAFADYAARVDAFGRRHHSEDWYGGWIEPEAPEDPAALAAAEVRLGFALPEDFSALLRRVGGASVGDHGFTGATALRSGYEAVIVDWGTPRELMERDRGTGRGEILQASTLLFTEVGDGLGGVFYRPPPVPACAGDAAYYWWHQESGDGMELIRAGDGACADFREVVWWLLSEYVSGQLTDGLPEGVVLVDSNSATTELHLDLDPFPDADQHGVSLGVRWRGPHANRPFDAMQTIALP